MLGEKLEKALNLQIKKELGNSYFYFGISLYFREMNLNGFGKWMHVQADEERGHAYKLIDYVLERGGKVQLMEIDAPPRQWKSPLDACEAAYQAEADNTKQINKLMDLALKENDHATGVMLQWFVSEQVEEEAQTTELVEHVKLAKGAPGPLLMLDRELGRRGSK
jgi:ferritin